MERTAQSPLKPHPAFYASRQVKCSKSDTERFLDEIKKLSAVGEQLFPKEIGSALKSLVTEMIILKVTIGESPYLRQLGVAEILNLFGLELVSPNADKYEMAQCDLGITQADYLLPETGTLVLRSSHEKHVL